MSSENTQIATIEAELSIATIPMNIQVIGEAAERAWDDYFAELDLRSENTCKAYKRATLQFLQWCRESHLNPQDLSVENVSNYFKQHSGSLATKSQHLSAIDRFLQYFVERHLVRFNASHGIKLPREKNDEVKTPVITDAEIKQLLFSIEPNSVVNFRDLAIMSVLASTGQREGAIADLRRKNFWDDGTQHILTFLGKGNKVFNTPATHDLTVMMQAYLKMTGIENASPDAPVFPKAKWRNSALTNEPMSGNQIYRMFKRRARVAGIRLILSPHSFRVHVANDLRKQGVVMEAIQALFGHADPATTQGYFRENTEIARNVVERISTQLPRVS